MRTLRTRRAARPCSLVSLALCALFLGGALLGPRDLLAQPASDSELAPRVCIQRSPRSDPLIDEAVVRILGELSIVGLDVEVLRREDGLSENLDPLETGTWGLLSLRREAELARIDAWAPNGGAPYTLEIDIQGPEITAEVIAIRAVEALRAKWIEYGELGGSRLPELVLRFARADHEGTPESSPASKSVSAPPESNRPRAPLPSDEVVPSPPPAEVSQPWARLQLWLGPSLTLETPSVDGLSLEGRLLLGGHGWFVGGSVGGALTALELNAEAGSAQIERRRYLGLLHGELPLDSAWLGFLQLGLGLHRFTIDATTTETLAFEARDSVQSKLGGLIRFGVSYWPHPAVGLYAEGELNSLVSALIVRMDERPIATLGAPATAVGLGLELRAPIRF